MVVKTNTKEKVVLAVIYKEDGMIKLDVPNKYDVSPFELYGFLECYLSILEDDLVSSLSIVGEDED